MGDFLVPADLTPFADIEAAKADLMITDAESLASLAAPCITDPEFVADAARAAQVRSILRGAILRWNEAGTGAFTQQQVGPFGATVDTRQQRGSMFWPSEVSQLRDLCAQFTQTGDRNAFAIDTAPVVSTTMYDRPDLWFQWV